MSYLDSFCFEMRKKEYSRQRNVSDVRGVWVSKFAFVTQSSLRFCTKKYAMIFKPQKTIQSLKIMFSFCKCRISAHQLLLNVLQSKQIKVHYQSRDAQIEKGITSKTNNVHPACHRSNIQFLERKKYYEKNVKYCKHILL